MDEEELAKRLTAVRGIGPWTVHMLMIFYLGHGNVMPTGDFCNSRCDPAALSKTQTADDCADVEARREVGALSQRGELVSLAVAGYEGLGGEPFDWAAGFSWLSEFVA